MLRLRWYDTALNVSHVLMSHSERAAHLPHTRGVCGIGFVRCPVPDSTQWFSCKLTISIPFLPLSHQLSRTHMHPPTSACARSPGPIRTLQLTQRAEAHDWLLVERQIQTANQWDLWCVSSPHHDLIKPPPMSLRFPGHWAALKNVPHCTRSIDHIRSDRVSPLPSAPLIFRLSEGPTLYPE